MGWSWSHSGRWSYTWSWRRGWSWSYTRSWSRCRSWSQGGGRGRWRSWCSWRGGRRRWSWRRCCNHNGHRAGHHRSVNPAVIGENSSGLECHWEGEPVVAYARIKYSIRIIWRTGRHAVIVGGPSPIDDIAGPDGDRARVEVGPALSHVNIRRRCGSEDWQQDQK